MDSTMKTSIDDVIKLKSDLVNPVEELQIELRKKDEDLAMEKQEKQKLLVDLELEKARANRAVTELASAQGMIDGLQMSLWRSFPSQSIYYYIKLKVLSGTENEQYRYLYADNSGHLRIDDRTCFTTRNEFEFTKYSNGTFSIYSPTKEKYLQINTRSRAEFSTTDEDNARMFVIFYHQQNQQAGFMVDIRTLGGSFLCRDYQNKIAADSRTEPADKFLIIPSDD